MARKHKKNRGIMKQTVSRTMVAEAQTERKILTNPETNELEVVHVTVKPAVITQGKAQGPTTRFGKTNTGGRGAGK